MLKKLLAILAALSMVLSLAACGSYEITIEKKDEEKVASDSVDENEEEFEEDEEEEEKEEETEEEKEEQTEEENEKDKEEKEDEKLLSSFDEVYEFLSELIDLDGYENQPSGNSDYDIYSYSMSYDEDKETTLDFSLKVNGKSLDIPTKYDTLKSMGFTFGSSMVNEKSEQSAKTTFMNWYFNAPGGGTATIYSVNPDDYSKPVTDVDFYAIRLEGYGFNFDEKKFEKWDSYTKIKINDAISFESSVEDVIDEFGTPNKTVINLNDTHTEIELKYSEGTGFSTESVTFKFRYYKGKSVISEVYYEFPETEI